LNHIPDTLASVRRVLVTRLRWLGDVVMSTPMLEALREALPQASIEYLAYTPFAPALEGHPACDRILALPPKAGPAATLSVVRELRRPRVDWCFDTLGNPRSAILIALAAPHHSVAPARGIRSYLYEHRQRHESGERSAVRHQLDMLIPLLGRVDMRPTSLFVGESERQEIAARLGLASSGDLVLIHPGATWPERAWPIERWPSLISALQQDTPGIGIRVITQPGWEAEAESIVARSGGDVGQLPALDLRSLMGLLAWASLYVGNDGGILHCAVALRVPTVGIFGPTDHEIWFPYASWGPYRMVRRRSEAPGDGGKLGSRFPNAPVDEVMTAIAEVRSRPRLPRRVGREA